MLKKIILLGLTAVLMTACGSNESGGVSSSGGSGVCVDVASFEDTVGLTERTKTTSYNKGKVTYSKIESSENKSSTKTSSTIIIYDDNENMTGKIETEYSISNGIMRLSKVIISYLSGTLPDFETTSVPYRVTSYKIGENCEGDSWENEYTTYTKIDDQEKSTGNKHHIKHTIEEVNVEKTVTAGTFNTVKIRTDHVPYDNGYNYAWRDIDTGYIVLLETYDADGKLTQKIEVLDIY